MSTENPRFQIVLEAIPGFSTNPTKQLARLLKYALRACGLRCRSARRLPEEENG
jgi:hypothetical protein